MGWGEGSRIRVGSRPTTRYIHFFYLINDLNFSAFRFIDNLICRVEPIDQVYPSRGLSSNGGRLFTIMTYECKKNKVGNARLSAGCVGQSTARYGE